MSSRVESASSQTLQVHPASVQDRDGVLARALKSEVAIICGVGGVKRPPDTCIMDNAVLDHNALSTGRLDIGPHEG